MDSTIKTYPDSEFNAFVRFSNENLPLPRMPLEQLKKMMNQHVRATINEVKMALALLSDEEIKVYGKWLDRRISGEFHCIFYEGQYRPLEDCHRIVEIYPPEAAQLLEDADSTTKNLKHKLSHRASALLLQGVEALDAEIWSLHEMMHEAHNWD